MAATTDFKSQLHTILEESLHFQAVEAAFFGLIIHDEDEEKYRKDLFLQTFKAFWSKLETENDTNEAINNFVEFANGQHIQIRTDYLYDLLQSLVEAGYVTAKKACEAILNSDLLKFDNSRVWRPSFAFIGHFLPQMDYKSLRGVFSVLLSRMNEELPDTILRSQEHLLNELKQVVLIGLDRNVGLLPSYFVVNEIYKLYPVENFHPHWALAKEFTSFVDSFKPLAQMVTLTGHSFLRPVVSHSGSPSNVWNLEPNTLKFPLKGPLPYKKEMIGPQKRLMQYVIAQPFSKDIVSSMLGLKRQQKQRCEVLEELLVDLVIVAMEKTETMTDADESHQLLWQHLSSQMIFFILFQFASFPHMVSAIAEKLQQKKLLKGRNKLMWVLLQFISGSIQKTPLADFHPVMNLFKTLYSNDKEPLAVPDMNSSDSTTLFAMTCIWMHLSKKAHSEKVSMQQPKVLQKQLDFLEESSQKKQHNNQGYEIALLCNAYSTNQESFQQPLKELVDKVYGGAHSTTKLPSPSHATCLAAGAIAPIPIKFLDSLTVHAKMSLIHGIVTRIINVARDTKSPLALAPALVETYSRLLVYMEIEVLGVKSFIGQVLPNVFRSQAWGILHTLLEMFSYRLHHIQPQYRVTLLQHLHSVATVPFTDRSQLQLCVQNTALRLITGFGSAEIQNQLSSQRIIQEPKLTLSKDCEELNRILILTMARAIHITGAETMPFNWVEGILKEACTITPHGWSSTTMQCFPRSVQQFYIQHPFNQEPGKQLLARVDQHYKKWKSASSDEERITYCTDAEQAVPEVFLCLMWKILQEQNMLTPVCYKVLMKLGPRALSNYLKTFADFLVHEFRIHGSDPQVNRRFQLLNEMIWKYNVFPLDRLILVLTLRNHEDKDSQICFYIIKVLLLNTQEFKTRIKKFVADNTAQHWNHVNWHERHTAYHEQFPERFYYEGILESNNLPVQSPEYLPTYFGNVCLRFLPVFDIVIHRLIELPATAGAGTLELLLKELGMLYKFHDRPITYLYNTLHYYEEKLRDKISLKSKLVHTIINSQKDNHPQGWACTSEMMEFLGRRNEGWLPTHAYFAKVVGRFVSTMQNNSPPQFPVCDWRFNEFPNACAHALHVTCVELMALPMNGIDVGNALIDVICSGNDANCGGRQNVMDWVNAVGIILTSLPQSYLQVVNEKVCFVLQNRLAHINYTSMSALPSFFDFLHNHAMNCEQYSDYVLAIFHATWLQASVGQFTLLPQFLKTQVKPLVTNEAQLLYVFALFGAFMQRFQQERMRWLFEISAEFYHMLEQVCKNTSHLVFVDVICDFLYHLKYRFVGDNLRETIEKTVGNFHDSLQFRLKFMASSKREEITPQAPPAAPPPLPAQFDLT